MKKRYILLNLFGCALFLGGLCLNALCHRENKQASAVDSTAPVYRFDDYMFSDRFYINDDIKYCYEFSNEPWTKYFENSNDNIHDGYINHIYTFGTFYDIVNNVTYDTLHFDFDYLNYQGTNFYQPRILSLVTGSNSTTLYDFSTGINQDLYRTIRLRIDSVSGYEFTVSNGKPINDTAEFSFFGVQVQSNNGSTKTFLFDETLNLNAYKDTNIDSMFVNDSYFNDVTIQSQRINLVNQPFISGGKYFERVDLWILNAYDKKYFTSPDSTNEWDEFEGINYGMVAWLEYSIDGNYGTSVYYREYVVVDDVNVFSFRFSWRSSNYRQITFLDYVSDETITKLDRFNTAININYGYITGGDGAPILTGVYSLFSSAFASMASFMGIMIFPGVSLGLLLFLPLIVGIILFIIWLVKR